MTWDIKDRLLILISSFLTHHVSLFSSPYCHSGSSFKSLIDCLLAIYLCLWEVRDEAMTSWMMNAEWESLMNAPYQGLRWSRGKLPSIISQRRREDESARLDRKGEVHFCNWKHMRLEHAMQRGISPARRFFIFRPRMSYLLQGVVFPCNFSFDACYKGIWWQFATRGVEIAMSLQFSQVWELDRERKGRKETIYDRI